jgi:vacuolar-type H+-ATPase subunit H
MIQKPDSNEAPDLKEIGEQLKALGQKLLKAADKAGESEQMKKINQDVADAYETLKESVKSGEMTEGVKREVKDALAFFNAKLDEFLKEEKTKK